MSTLTKKSWWILLMKLSSWFLVHELRPGVRAHDHLLQSNVCQEGKFWEFVSPFSCLVPFRAGLNALQWAPLLSHFSYITPVPSLRSESQCTTKSSQKSTALLLHIKEPRFALLLYNSVAIWPSRILLIFFLFISSLLSLDVVAITKKGNNCKIVKR